MRTEREFRELGDFLRSAFGEFGMCVQAGSDRCATDCQIVEAVECFVTTNDVAIELVDVTREFLTERQRRCILEMRAPNLDNVRPGLRFSIERITQLLDRR